MKLLVIGIALVLGFGCGGAVSSSERVAKDSAPAEKPLVPADSAAEHSQNEDNDAPRIMLADAKKAFDDGDAVFVDTRGSTFFENEHVKGAINIPSGEFDQLYESVPKDKKIIAYCS